MHYIEPAAALKELTRGKVMEKVQDGCDESIDLSL